jgi:hypothetical protein
VNSPRPDKGVALITVILIMTLISAMMVGLAWLVMSDQKLGGNNNDRQLAFYGAEAGMESLTASLENAFDANYAQNATSINAIMTTPGPPTNIPNIQYLAPGSTTNGSGYLISFTPSAANANIPASSFSTLTTGTYAGLVALATPYTLSVTAHTTYGSEVKLQRRVQTVAIPVFQFGIFSQTDLSFFAGPDFDFGGRVHTNGNLWLAEGDGSTLTLQQKVDAAGQIITANLENGFRTTTGYNGAINITNGSGFQNLMAQAPSDSVTGTANSINNVSSYDTTFAGMASTIFNGNIAVGQTGASVLNIAIATPAIGGQPIDLIRRPVANEDTSNAAKLAERYYSQVSLRVMLSDYAATGGCAGSDISSTSGKLPLSSPNAANSPVDLATLAWDQSVVPTGNSNTTLPYHDPPAWQTVAQIGKTIFPLPTSGAQAASYSATDGYWVQKWYPTITGCIKIDYQTVAGGAFTDVTTAILNQGYTGRDINPQTGAGGKIPPLQPTVLPGAQVRASGPTVNGAIATITCVDPSPGAIIRLARVRDNPSWAPPPAGGCAAPPVALASQHGGDYWPNVLYDTREGLLRDNSLANQGSGALSLPVAGAMYYVELDVAKLATWFTTNSAVVNKTTGYSVYFSDRRGNQPDPAPPASVGGVNALTGGFGYSEIVNGSSANGCPDNTLNQGEDVEGDFNSAGVDLVPILRTYGDNIPPANGKLWPIASVGTQLGTPATILAAILQNNPGCAGAGSLWPYAIATDPQDLRENPPLFFRRALKIVNGSTISLGTCNSVPCGLTIVSENPIYLQGDYNNPGLNTAFTGASVGASVIADAVTLLSDNWNDVNSFAFPFLNVNDQRVASDTTFRLAISGGKGIPFPIPTVGAPANDFGTDGGTHNFLRYLEDWGGGAPTGTLWYEGSIVSMYYNHQGVGTYKCCSTVYNPPVRAYQFDTNFLTPNLLPPLTPMLRAINTIGFTQILLPTQ